MTTGSSKTSSTPSASRPAADGGGISTFKGQERALRADRLGTAGLLLSVLAATAPLMVVAGVMPTAFAVMGIVGQPLLFVILGVVLVLFSVGYAEMSRHVHNAGAFYAYVARGLGGTAGAGAALVALAAYSALQVGIYGIFGFEVSGLFATYLEVEVAWWIPALAAALVVGVLGWLKIDVNALVLGVLLLIEVALVVIFDVAAVADPAAEGLSLHAFNPDTLTGAGVGTALCFCIAAFTGFEQAPVYAEETSRPQILVPRAMFLAIGFVAVFFAFSSWALTVAAGPSGIVGAAQKQSAGLLFFLTEPRLGETFTDVLHVLFVTGMFAALLSFHNVVARYAFAMGREGLLPAAFGRTAGTSGAPARARSCRPSSPCWSWPASRWPTTSRPVTRPRPCCSCSPGSATSERSASSCSWRPPRSRSSSSSSAVARPVRRPGGWPRPRSRASRSWSSPSTPSRTSTYSWARAPAPC